jgi:formate dehydrogenase subunit delta
MDPNRLARMINDIAEFFAAYPRAEAEREIAAHLTRFWEPRMRQALLAHAARGGEDLTPLARAALQRLAAAAA